MLIGERDAMLPPVDVRVVLAQPRHTEYDIVSDEWTHDEIELFGIRADANLRTLRDGGVTLSAVGECDGGSVARWFGDDMRRVTTNEFGRHEVAGATAVDEDDRWLMVVKPVDLDQGASR